MLRSELDISKRQAVKVRSSQEAREMVQALMMWGDDGGAIVRTTNQPIKENGEKS